MIFLFAEGSILFIKLKVIAKELFQWSILRQDKWQNMFLVVVNLYLQIVLERKFPFTLSSISTFSQNLVFQRLDLSYFWSHFDLVEMNIQIICQPSVNFINVKRAIFSYERCFSSFPLVTCTYKKLQKWHSYIKFACLTLMKLTTIHYCLPIIGFEIKFAKAVVFFEIPVALKIKMYSRFPFSRLNPPRPGL